MALLTGDARYSDLIERTLYNGFLAGVSLDGTRWLYVNPLQVRDGYTHDSGDQGARRTPWFRCACCPPNVMRLLASLPHYLASTNRDGLQLHQYATGTFAGTVGDTDGTVTGYSWVFGDGSDPVTGTPGVDGSATAAHTFTAPGTYSVVLTATDDLGASGHATRAVVVVGNDPPTAAFVEACTDLDCTFDASGSTDVAPGTIVDYSWDWGDGSPVETGAPGFGRTE